jgi:CT1975-like protein
MTKIIELHILRANYGAPNNGEDGEPKTIRYFDGTERTIVSSQARKRTARNSLTKYGLGMSDTAAASVRWAAKAAEELVNEGMDNRSANGAATVTMTALVGSTDTIALLPHNAIDTIKSIARNIASTQPRLTSEVGEALNEIASTEAELANTKHKPDRTKLEKKIKDLKTGIKTAVKSTKIPLSTFSSLFDTSVNAEIALCGRMIASNKIFEVDSNVAVAPAINVIENRPDINGPHYQPDIDFFSASDTFAEATGPGNAHIGTRSRSASIFYEHTTIDSLGLTSALQGDILLATKTIRAFLNAIVRDNAHANNSSTAATNPPTTILITTSDYGLGNLNHAFAPAIKSEDPLAASTERLVNYHLKTIGMMTPIGLKTYLATTEDINTDPSITRIGSLEEIINNIINDISY